MGVSSRVKESRKGDIHFCRESVETKDFYGTCDGKQVGTVVISGLVTSSELQQRQ